jgi:hypothetical protein
VAFLPLCLEFFILAIEQFRAVDFSIVLSDLGNGFMFDEQLLEVAPALCGRPIVEKLGADLEYFRVSK